MAQSVNRLNCPIKIPPTLGQKERASHGKDHHIPTNPHSYHPLEAIWINQTVLHFLYGSVPWSCMSLPLGGNI